MKTTRSTHPVLAGLSMREAAPLRLALLELACLSRRWEARTTAAADAAAALERQAYCAGLGS